VDEEADFYAKFLEEEEDDDDDDADDETCFHDTSSSDTDEPVAARVGVAAGDASAPPAVSGVGSPAVSLYMFVSDDGHDDREMAEVTCAADRDEGDAAREAAPAATPPPSSMTFPAKRRSV